MTMKQKGFTLLELIIVIIVIGVLAAIALPRYFQTLEFSRSSEALNSLSAVRRAIDRCATWNNGDYTNCLDLTQLDISDISASSGTHFSYGASMHTSFDPNCIMIYATRNTLDGGNTNDKVRLHYDISTGQTKTFGSGSFQPLGQYRYITHYCMGD
ncbi:MAG: prepilin-type N-terminal cleavage/methylation domain-containing protein [Candidatus Omnitrophica bacterium]|nr:prepilin-type N-terminal cleavage/methylation domain-containing protein [Candidatus Omnitrophota bacterium]